MQDSKVHQRAVLGERYYIDRSISIYIDIYLSTYIYIYLYLHLSISLPLSTYL